MTECKIYDEVIDELKEKERNDFKDKVKLITSFLDVYEKNHNKLSDSPADFAITFAQYPELTEEEMVQLPEDFIVKYNEVLNALKKAHKENASSIMGCLGLIVIVGILIAVLCFS